jgi:transcriptional regulator NrdR family protein
MIGRKKPETNEPPKGIRCPACNCAHVPVLYTRPANRGVRRVRACRNCGRRISTFERTP